MNNKPFAKLDIPQILEILQHGECFPENLFDIPSLSSSDLKELELFTCPICTGIFNEAVIDNCNPPHTFGLNCITQCLTKKPLCPFSRSQLKQADLRKIPAVFQYFLEKIPIKCVFSSYGCQWIGEKSQISSHIKENCLFSYLIQTEIIVNELWDLEKMPKTRLEKISVIQISMDMLNFPIKSAKEISLLANFSNLKELSLDFKFHSFDNHHKEFDFFNKALNSLTQLQTLSIIFINKYAECVNEFNFLYWYDIEKHDVEIREMVNWKGLKDQALENIFLQTFEKCKEIQTINLNFSYNALTAEGISNLIEKISKLKKIREVFLDFSCQKELNVKIGEKITKKKPLKKCFSEINLRKNLGFLFFTKKTLEDVGRNQLGNKLKTLII